MEAIKYVRVQITKYVLTIYKRLQFFVFANINHVYIAQILGVCQTITQKKKKTIPKKFEVEDFLKTIPLFVMM